MSKYEPLWDWVGKQPAKNLTLTFAEIQQILGFPIDHSFLNYKKESFSCFNRSPLPRRCSGFLTYDDIRTKLLNAGVPEQEIEFIHNADTENKKAELFSKVRSGQVRVLLGSTAKMGAGTNVQTLLVAVHHLDVGWRPSDMTQRNGRIIRQGKSKTTGLRL